MKFSALSYISALALMALGVSSCADEIEAPVTADDQLVEGAINFRCADMLEVNYGAARAVSRAGASKSPAEKRVNTLHVFFFNPDDGKLLTPNYPQDFPSYQRVDDKGSEAGCFLPVKDTSNEAVKQLFVETPNDKIYVVALANIDATDDAPDAKDEANKFRTVLPDGTVQSNGKIQKASRAAIGDADTDFEVKSLDDLKEWVYYPRMRMDEQTAEGDIEHLPKAGMPMICIGQDINLNKGNSTPTVNMVSMMAKINVTVELDPDQYTSQYPILEITDYGVRNMPVAVPFKAHTGGLLPEKKDMRGDDIKNALATPGNFEGCATLFDVTTEPMYHIGGSGDGGNHCLPSDHEFVYTLSTPRIINKDSAPVRFTYYTYENINVPDYGAERANGSDAFVEDAVLGDSLGLRPSYPDGVDGHPEEYQRWKSTLAYNFRASALVLKGTFTNHQGMRYKAQFTVYLGSDADKDFTVRRNHQYDNTITIHGLDYIRNSTDDVYTFDGRVNVVDDNPFYLAVVNERNVDAHASALPMDVWLMYREPENTAEYYSEVTVEIPASDTAWVQMVMIPRAEMEANNFKAGTGCEPYFYTYLLNDIKWRPNNVLNGNTLGGVGYPGHMSGAQCGSKVVITSTPANAPNPINNSRARVYFYIDENTTITDAEASQMLTTPNLKDRMVSVDITYRRYTKDASGEETTLETRRRTLDIEQRGLRRVPATWYSNPDENGNRDKDDIPETYIEYTEEYLNHNDPLEPHYETGEFYNEGLIWGLDNVGVNYYRTLLSGSNTTGFRNIYDGAGGATGNGNPADGRAYNIYKKNSAMAMTQWAVDHTKTTDPMSDIRLFNEKKPASAFHYCYSKNKRNYDGSVPAVTVPTTGDNANAKGWYMPGIRELECALVEYWNDFTDFQNKFYWSSSCGGLTNNLSYSTADRHRARATKVDTAGRYVNSGADGAAADNPGYKLRDEECRIRAFYRRN